MRIIGEYEEFGPGMGYPSIRAYIGDEPHPAKERILQYLRNGHIHMVTASRVVDAITGDKTNVELVFMDDGQYSWSSKVTYHVDKYNLQLPEVFINHIESKRLEKSECRHVPPKLQNYIGIIMEGHLAEEEWLTLEKEIDTYLAAIPDDLKDLFAYSGAGEALYMMCSGIRHMREGRD